MNRVGGQARGRKAAEPGFSLIEMAIAIAIIAFTFIGLIGLMGLGVTNDHTSSEQTAANNIAASILADLRSTPVYATTSTRYGMTLPTSPANATTPINTSAAPLGGIKPVSLYFDNSPAFISMNPSSDPDGICRRFVHPEQ
jgi:prepilin-type N-terminal cleavage/methylation domain-containing protein